MRIQRNIFVIFFFNSQNFLFFFSRQHALQLLFSFLSFRCSLYRSNFFLFWSLVLSLVQCMFNRYTFLIFCFHFDLNSCYLRFLFFPFQFFFHVPKVQWHKCNCNVMKNTLVPIWLASDWTLCSFVRTCFVNSLKYVMSAQLSWGSWMVNTKFQPITKLKYTHELTTSINNLASANTHGERETERGRQHTWLILRHNSLSFFNFPIITHRFFTSICSFQSHVRCFFFLFSVAFSCSM